MKIDTLGQMYGDCSDGLLETIMPSTDMTESCEVTERLTDMGKNRLSTNDNDTAKTTTTTKRARLFANPDIKRWYDNLA